MGVALLADLSQLQHHVAAGEARADGEALQVEALHDDVLAEGTVSHVGPARLEGFDLLVGQKAHLAVPRPAVGVALDAPIGLQLDGVLLGFLDSLDVARAYGFDNAHDAPFSLATGRAPLSTRPVHWTYPRPAARREGETSARENSSEFLDYPQGRIIGRVGSAGGGRLGVLG